MRSLIIIMRKDRSKERLGSLTIRGCPMQWAENRRARNSAGPHRTQKNFRRKVVTDHRCSRHCAGLGP